jgi:hypothetical protein
MGSGHVLTGNTAQGCGWDGFDVAATDTRITDCVAKDSGRDGFHIAGAGTTLTRCSSSDAAADGVHCAASNVSFTGCTMRGNRQDVAADAGAPLIDGGGNKYDTGAVDATPIY